MSKLLTPLLLALILAACDSSGGSSSSSSSTSDPNTPGTPSITSFIETGGEAEVNWSKSSGADGNSWSLFHNDASVEACQATLAASADGNQSGGCSVVLEEGANQLYVSLCNLDDNGDGPCSDSAEHSHNYQPADPSDSAPGAITLAELDSLTYESELYVTWSKASGANGDSWAIYRDGALACSANLTPTTSEEPQSGGCYVDLEIGANAIHAELCISSTSLCSQSATANVTRDLDPAQSLAQPVIDQLATSAAVGSITIAWSKDTSTGSLGESWRLAQNGSLACAGELSSGATGASCIVDIALGANDFQVELCTDSSTYSGANCALSDVVSVEGLHASATTPGTIDLLTNYLSETYQESVSARWSIESGDGVQSWMVLVDGARYCATESTSTYHTSGECEQVGLELGDNTISIYGCNYGFDGSEACTYSDSKSVQRLALPGQAEIIELPASSYDDALQINWTRSSGASAESWLALVNEQISCPQSELSTDAEAETQSGSCSVELASGHNSVVVRLCVADALSNSYCTDSEPGAIELLAPIPGLAVITTPSQSTGLASVDLTWERSVGAAAATWQLSNNGSEVAACAGTLEASEPQQGSCTLSLNEGANLIKVTLCNSNAAGSLSCSTSDPITIEREFGVPYFTSANSASVPENTTSSFYTATASDDNSDLKSLSFAISGGADQDFFTIDSASGALSFSSAPDFEAPQDQGADNTYAVELEVLDEQSKSSNLALQVIVADVDDVAPAFTSATAITIPENSTGVVYLATASDADSVILSFAISGGADAAHFDINSSNGELSPGIALDFENPQDSNQDNIYQLELLVTDPADNSGQLSLSVTIEGEYDEAPVVPTEPQMVDLSLSSISTDSVIYTVVATDVDLGDQLTYSLGGVDAAHFNLDSATGELSFATLPSASEPQDANGDNVYETEVSVHDLGANSASFDLSISVDASAAPEFSVASASVEFPENSTAVVYDANATDANGDQLTYSLAGADAALFGIDADGGAVSFQQAPDFESPQDQGQDNAYELEISASDGFASASQTLSVSVTNLNDESPQLTSAQSVALNFSEISLDSVIHTVTATDPDPEDQLTYSLGGADAASFALDSASGELSFTTLPSLDTPQDADQDNIYDLETIITDLASNSSSFALTISVADDIGSAPEFSSDSVSVDFAENSAAIAYTAAASDPEGDAITYSLGGTDADLFELDSTSGALSFKQAPDYEAPLDSDKDNDYRLTISAHDPIGNQAQQSLTITITNLNDNSPTFVNSTPGLILVPENTSATTILYTASATDLDGDTIAYSLSGTDAAHFNLDPETAALSFIAEPNYEIPFGDNLESTYNITVNATDADNTHSTSVDLSVEISDVDEAPQFAQDSETIEIPENTSSASTIYTAAASDEDGDTITYSLSGTDAAHFTLNSATGGLNFVTSPDFENPQDQDGDNDYNIEIKATSTSHSTTLQLSIAITDVEEYAPYFDNAASVASLTEDPSTEGQQTPILALEFEAYDVEDDAANRALSLELEGADSSLFQLATSASANSYQVHFITSPDFDHPHDSDQDSNYSFTIVATDSDGTESQFSSTIVVEGINDEAPYIDPAAYTYGDIIPILENNTSVLLTLAAYDEDRSDWSDVDPARRYQPNLDHLSFALTATIAESDSDLFYLDPTTLELSPKEPFDYETPQQQGATANLYQIEIALTDSAGNSNLDHSDPSTRIVYVQVEDIENEAITTFPEAETGPQIPWFHSNSSAWEYIKIPWVIYAGDGVAAWDMYVNGELKCSVASGLSSSLSSGTCAVPSSEFTIGSIDNTAQVSVVYADGRVDNSKTVTFGFAVPESEGYYPEQPMFLGGSIVDSGIPSDCADVEIGEPVNHDSHSSCYAYLLYDGLFGGLYNDVAAYLWSGKYGRSFDVIGYFIEWGVYARDFDPHDMVANWLSTVLYSFIKFEGDNTTADDECENCTFSGAVAIADPWAALDKPFYMPGEEEKYADDAETEEELAEILLDKGVSTGKGIFQQFWLLKQKFPHLKTCLSVGGWSFSRPFPLVASDPDKRATFAQSIVDMAVEYHFDCIDIDWEFPGKAGGDRVATHNGVATYDLDGDGISPFVDPSEADADYYVDLVATLRAEIDSRSEAKHIEINSAVYTSSEGMALMDYGSFPADLDGIHMMTYDYYGAWDPHTGLQAALYANTDPVSSDVALAYGNPYNPEHNIASAMARGVNNAIYNGFRPEMVAVDDDSATSSISEATLANLRIRQKIVPGLAFYGRNYSGVNMDTPTPLKYMVRATGTTGQSDGSAEQLGWEPGNLNYHQIRGFYFQDDKVQGDGDYVAYIPDADDPNIIHEYSTEGRSWTYNWDDEAQAPFLYDAETGSFVTYSDPRAIFYQTCHAAWHNSKGVMFWELSGDNLAADLQLYIQLALRGYRVVSGDRDYATCEDLDGIYPQDDIVYSDGSDGGGDSGLAGYGLAELVDLGHVSEDLFSNFIFPWRNGDPSISDGSETYTWDGFATAAEHFADFGFLNEGSIEDRLRELAAFFANTSQETHNSHGVYALINKDGIIGQGRYNAGYYYQQEQACAVGGADYGQDICSYCDASHATYGAACAWLYENGSTKADDFYYGRGPMQLQSNSDYGDFGQYYYQDPDLLLYNPNMLVQDSEAAFASAIWYWMAERDGKPSAHDVMILGNYSYDPETESSERYPGFGMTINVTRGESECGSAYDHDANRNRIGFFITYLNILDHNYSQGLSPWVGTNGSDPSISHDFPDKVEDLISEHEDVEKYLSCKNMQNYE